MHHPGKDIAPDKAQVEQAKCLPYESLKEILN